jgi:hypothetical protein
VRSLLIAMLTACGSSPPPEAAPAPVEEPIAAPHVEPVVEAEPAPASALECSVDRWCRIHASGPDLEAIFAASATDVFAGGSDTTLLRWDGREWSGGSNPELTGANRTADVYAMHGADGLVLASGNEGYLTRFDGSAWSRAGSGTQADLHGVFVRSANDAWIAGNGGTLLHFDGTDCTRERVPARGSLLAVWSAGAQVFVVGAEGELVHREESGRWRARPSGTTESLEAVWGTSATDVFALGDSVLVHFDGSRWSEEAIGAEGLRAIGGAGEIVYAVGRGGLVVRRHGGEWRSEASGVTEDLLAVSVAPDRTAFAAGEGGVVLMKPRE